MKEINWKKRVWFDNRKTSLVRDLCGPGTIGHIRRGHIGYRIEGELNYEIPWAFVNMSGRGCGIRNDIYWKQFGIIPKTCRHSCYKVCIRLQSVYELYMYLKDFEQMATLFGWGGKCGIDLRWYTRGPYAGYVYHSSLDAAQECYEYLREHVQDNENYCLLNNVESVYNHELITVKKGCTEMQHPGNGGFPSDTWEKHELVPQWDEDEAHLDSILDLNDATDGQPEWLHNKIVYTWCEFAHLIGDRTYIQVLGEDPFEFKEVTYHKRKEVEKEVHIPGNKGIGRTITIHS